MIRFNGYPFLEKEDKEDNDYAYIEPSESRKFRQVVEVATLTHLLSRQRDESGYHRDACERHAHAGDR